MSLFSNIISTIAKPAAVIAPIVGGPVGTAVAVVASAKVKQDADRQRKEQIEIFNRNRKKQMSQFFNQQYSDFATPGGRGSTSRAGFGADFGSFLGDLSSNIVNPFLNFVSPFTDRFRTTRVDQPAITTPTIGGGGQETTASGTSDAFVGGAGSLLTGASKFLKSPGGSFLTGLFGGVGASLIDPMTGKTKRITRKMKSQARMLLNMTGGNLQVTADMLGISQEELVFILLKRFRNDGPVVTKAALRKTKQTVKRLKNMCDMYDSLRPAARRRTTPMKRAGTTLISNK